MESLLNAIATYLGNITPADVYHVGLFLASGTGVAIFVQIIKHVKNLKDRKILLQTLNGAVSFIATFGAYHTLLAGSSFNNVVFHSTGVAAASAIAYRIAVNPLYNKIVSNWLSVLADANIQRASVAPQSVTPYPDSKPSVPVSEVPANDVLKV